MISRELLDEQVALELPGREMMQLLNLNIYVPVIVQQNVNVQVCGVGVNNSATCSSVQGNWSHLPADPWGN
jgi:hypothetical protein